MPIWNEEEIKEMMAYLHNHRQKAGDDWNFRDSEYSAAADHIAPYHTHGPVKTARMVQAKYRRVSGRY